MIKLPKDKELAMKILEFETKKMELGHSLAAQGLKSGSTGVGLAFVGVIVILILAYVTNPDKQALFSGLEIIGALAVFITGLVAYFTFVFRRELKLVAQLNEDFRLDLSTSSE